MEEALRKLAEEFESRMESAMKTKNEVYFREDRSIKEYWAGKEQAFYEAWQMVEAIIKPPVCNGRGVRLHTIKEGI